MKSSLDLKKCEQKLNTECRSISQKEAEKSKLVEECIKRKNEITSIHNLIRESNNTRNEIKEELYKIRQQVEKRHDEMNRTKAELLYKTKREYEEMIRRLENEMQFNHRPFSSREETRILNEITSLKHGIILLDSYEEQKRTYDELKEALTSKKNRQDQIWNGVTEYKKRYHNENEEIKLLNKEIAKINEDLDQMKSNKLGLKKKIEDLSREQVAKQQQIKRQSLEKLRTDRQFKKDQLIISMEENLRDCNKLINYFHKLIYGKEDTSDNDNTKSYVNQSFMSSSFVSGSGGYQPSSESSSLGSSMNSVQFNQTNALTDLKNQLTLGLQNTNNNNNNLSPVGENYHLTLNESLTPLPSPSITSLSNANTPNYEDKMPFFSNTGAYLPKKKCNELNNNTQPNRKNRKGKKHHKNAKISHSVEVINLLSKMDMPIHLSSQLEECLKELHSRQENFLNEMNLYKLNIELVKQEQLNIKNKFDSDNQLKINSSANNSNISDTNSDISSCLDSNYESDNNSCRSFQSSFLVNAVNNENINQLNDSLGLVTNPIELKSDDIRESLDKLGNQPNVTSTSSNGPTNSDDSDVTINESSLNEKELKILSAQLKKNQITTLTRTKSSPAPNETSPENKLDTTNNFSFFRQLSDGYSSSCTPLSANSISNEQPHINPFFLASSQSPPSFTATGQIKTSDPIETAFLNTNNLNK